MISTSGKEWEAGAGELQAETKIPRLARDGTAYEAVWFSRRSDARNSMAFRPG